MNIIEGLEAREIHKNIDDMAKIVKEMMKSIKATDGYKQSLYRYFMSQRTELELKLGLVKDVESFQPKSYESNSFVQAQGEEQKVNWKDGFACVFLSTAHQACRRTLMVSRKKLRVQ